MTRSITDILLHSLFLAGIVYILWNPYNDGDIWWHIAAGKEILATFAIPQTDEWSFTSNGARPIYHSWLGGVFFAIIWQAGGLAALEAVKYLVHLATVILVYGFSKKRVGIYFALLLALLVAFWLQGRAIRPHIFTPLLAVYFFMLVNRPVSWRTLALPPLLMALWVNLHGGFVVGLYILFAAFIGECASSLFDKRGITQEVKIKFWMVLLSFIATFCNPYGVDLYMRVIEGVDYASFDWVNITIWPPSVHLMTVIVLAATLYYVAESLVALCGGDRKVNVNLLAQSLLMYFFLITARRLDWLLFIPAYMLFGAMNDSLSKTKWLSKTPAFAVALVLVLLCGWKSAFFPKDPLPFPKGFNEYLANTDLQGNMFAPLTWSGKVTLLTEGRVKIYIDGRLELYPNYHFPDYLDILHEKGLTRGQIEAYGIDYLLLPTGEYDRFVLAASPIRWNPLKVSDGAILLERIRPIPLAGRLNGNG